jgi:hypothetical protein
MSFRNNVDYFCVRVFQFTVHDVLLEVFELVFEVFRVDDTDGAQLRGAHRVRRVATFGLVNAARLRVRGETAHRVLVVDDCDLARTSTASICFLVCIFC